METENQRYLRKMRDKHGWKPPYHEHFKLLVNGGNAPSSAAYDPSKPPVYAVNCRASECEAPGCPKTQSGFPE